MLLLSDTLVRWAPQAGPQTQALRRSEYEIGCGGARGGGKTITGFIWMSDPDYFNHPRFRGLVIRRNAKDLDDWIFRAKDFWGADISVGGVPCKAKLPAGGEIVTGHMADLDAWEQYQGHEYQKILFEELTQLPLEKQYLALIQSCRSSIPELQAQVMSNWNWGGAGHSWVKARFNDRCRGQTYTDPVSRRARIFIPSKLTDNKILMDADPAYHDGLKALPEQLRKAWLDGDPDAFDGQFFNVVDQHIIAPFMLPNDCQGRLIGSLDHGIAHYTSFGLWYVESSKKVYRVASYFANGGTTRGHAEDIWQLIEACRWTYGFFPVAIHFDPSMGTEQRMSERYTRAHIDEYREVFGARSESMRCQFLPANNRKPDGCATVRAMLQLNESGASELSVFSGLNNSFIDGLRAVEADENNPEIYAKADGDDAADEGRYGCVAAKTFMAQLQRLEPSKTMVNSDLNRSGKCKSIKQIYGIAGYKAQIG